MENLSMFDMFNDIEEIKVFEEEQKKSSNTIKKENSTKKETKSEGRKSSTKKVMPPKKSEKEIIQENCSKYKKIILKIYAEVVRTWESKEDISTIDIDNILEEIVQPLHPEFNSNSKWYLIEHQYEEGSAILIPVNQFYAKG